MRPKQLQKESDVLRHIADASAAIRRKHKELKLGKDATQRVMNEALKPVITPLQKLVDNTDLSKLKNKEKEQQQIVPRGAWGENRGRDTFFDTQTYDMSHTLQPIAAASSTPSHETTLKERKLEDFWKNQSSRTVESLWSNDDDESLHKSLDESVIAKETSVHDRIQQYLQKLEGPGVKELDTEYGVRKLKQGLKIGNAPVNFNGDKMILLDKTYRLTPGLASLIFERGSFTSLPTESDQNTYRSIIHDTNAHRKNYSPSQEIRQSSSLKYRETIKPLVLFPEPTKFGSALLPQYMIAPQSTSRQTDYVYWDNPNELVDRLRLLIASQAAGNTSHTNEIFSIIEELREAGIVY